MVSFVFILESVGILLVYSEVGSFLLGIPEAFHQFCPKLTFRAHHFVYNVSIVIFLAFLHVIDSVHTRIVMLLCLEVLVDVLHNPLVHLTVILSQVYLSRTQFLSKVALLAVPSSLQSINAIGFFTLHFSLFSYLVSYKEHTVSLQSVLLYKVEVGVSCLLCSVLAGHCRHHFLEGVT